MKAVSYTHLDVYKRQDEEQVPRHKEVNENLAKAILRKWGL